MTPEQQARSDIDKLLSKAGWLIQDAAHAHISAGPGVAIREFPLPGHGFADYLLYVNGLAAGIIEAKKAGATLSGVEIQSDKYSQGLPAALPAWRRPLPFSYQSTGNETRFTNGLDPEPRARPVFAFHRPEMLAAWLESAQSSSPPLPVAGGWGEGKPRAAEAPATYTAGGGTFLARLRNMPPPIEEGLDEVSIDAMLPSPPGRGAGGEGGLFAEPEPIEHNPAIPIETFDIIVNDECHRSIMTTGSARE